MKKKGFTLVELLAVIAILAVLVIIALPNVLKMFRNAKQNTFANEVQNLVRSAEDKYLTSSLSSGNNTCFDSKTNPLDMTGRDNINYLIKLSSKGKVIEVKVIDDSYQLLIDNESGINKADIGNKYKVETRNKTTDILDCNNSFLVEGEEGTGDEDTPYKIQYIEDLVELSNNVDNGETYAGKTFILSRNLDFKNKNSYKDSETTKYKDINGNGEDEPLMTELTTGSGFKPIGANKSFRGTFDGQNHRIDNLYIYNNKGQFTRVGFIGATVNGTIKNLTIGGNIKTDYNNDVAGITAGLSASTIDNCVNEVNIEITKDNTYSIGGLTASVNGNSVIRNSINKANLTLASGGQLGGLVGCVNSSGGDLLIENSHNEGNITSLKAGHVGGIIGRGTMGTVESSITIKNSYNNGEINVNSEEDKDINVGGIIGYVHNDTTLKIDNSYNLESITNLHTNFNVEKFIYMGGIIGRGYKSKNIILNKAYNNGILKDGTVLGGLVGDTYNVQKIIINQGYNTGTLSQVDFSNIDYAQRKLGGLIGFSETNTKNYIINSYNIGNINGNKTNGPAGLVGYNYGNTNTHIYNSYNAGNINNDNNSGSIGIVTVSGTNVSSLTINNVYNLGNVITSGIARVETNTILNIKNAYYKNDTIKNGTGLSNDSELTIGKSESEIKSAAFVNTLNENKKTIDLSSVDSELSGYTLCNWILGASGYPELDCK